MEKLVVSLHNKKEYAIHVGNLKQAINNELVFKRVHGVNEFNQKALLKPYIDMNK